MKSDVARLCLGTAQFGSHYGATNKTGKPSAKEIARIVDCAYAAGIRHFDTAVAYNARFVVPEGCKVITKVRAHDIDNVRGLFDSYAILAHDAGADHLVHACRAAGYQGRIGQSVYDGDAVWGWAQVIQFPLSLADRRIDFACMQRGLERFARSVFLQGKLLEMGYSVAGCLGFVLRQPIDYAVVGVNTVRELEEIIRAANDLPENVPEIPGPTLTARELDPRMW